MTSYARYSLRDVPNISKSINSLQWSGDGKLLSVITNDKGVKILSLDNSGTFQTAQSTQFPTQMTQLCWKPDASTNQYALMSDDKPIEIWDMRGNITMQTFSDLDISLLSCHTNYYSSQGIIEAFIPGRKHQYGVESLRPARGRQQQERLPGRLRCAQRCPGQEEEGVTIRGNC